MKILKFLRLGNFLVKYIICMDDLEEDIEFIVKEVVVVEVIVFVNVVVCV